MQIVTVAGFWAVSMLFVITPGADWAYAISAGLTNRAAVPSVSGLLLGHLVATIIVAIGAGALITSVPHATTTLTMVGAAYLLWLGAAMLRNPPKATNQDTDTQTVWWRWALKGFGVSGLNPKVFLLFLAILPQFTDLEASWPVSVQMGALGLLHVFNCAVIYIFVSVFAKAVLRSRPTVAQMVGRFSGAAMMGIAVFLIVERIH